MYALLHSASPEAVADKTKDRHRLKRELYKHRSGLMVESETRLEGSVVYVLLRKSVKVPLDLFSLY